MLSAADVSIESVLRFFTSRGIEAVLLVPTATGMKKSIMDATSSVRDFLRRAGIHDFSEQPQGQDHKRLVGVQLVTSQGVFRTEASLYRPITKKGDPRIWISGLRAYAEPGNVLALVASGDGELLVVNASSAGVLPGAKVALGADLFVRDSSRFDLDVVLRRLIVSRARASDELLGLMKAIAGRWHRGQSGEKRDFEVGRLLEELLGIKANSSKNPDYKGIEIKASRRKPGNRQTLFAKVPDWSISPFKSSAQILDEFGYVRNPKYRKQLRCTVSAKLKNSQDLFLKVEDNSNLLVERSTRPKFPVVVRWPIESLQAKLHEKHPETFWVSAATRREGSTELFMYERVFHTRAPIVSALPTLLEAGIMTVDHLIKRDLEGKVSEQGPLFKIPKSSLDLLFPPGMLHIL
jgi:MvaI/BcnI restriction endonuclease family